MLLWGGQGLASVLMPASALGKERKGNGGAVQPWGVSPGLA